MPHVPDSSNKSESWKIFDQIYATYDQVNSLLSMGIDKRWRRRLAACLPPGEKLELLDLATGTGEQLFSLMQLSEKIETATGIDLSEQMLKMAREKAKGSAKNVQFLHADALHLPFEKERFDCATISFGIRNVAKVSECMKEVHRVLKRRGRFLVLEFSLPKNQVVKPFYLLYLRHVLPRVGGLLARNLAAYRYLNQTIESFPYGKAFCDLMEEAGFCHVTAMPLTGGIATLYTGDKM